MMPAPGNFRKHLPVYNLVKSGHCSIGANREFIFLYSNFFRITIWELFGISPMFRESIGTRDASDFIS